MEQYSQIMSVDAVMPFVLGYSAHGVLAGIQVGIALVLLLSGSINVFRNQDVTALRHLGFTNNITGTARRPYGLLQISTAILLLLPLYFAMPTALSLLPFASLILIFFVYPRMPSLNTKQQGKYSQYAILLFSIFAIFFIQYERLSPLQAMKLIVNDITEYRPLEQQWQNSLDALAPKVGKPAKNFALTTSDQEKLVQLSDYLGEKPVVLFLGANSCPVFSEGIKDINALHKIYGDRVNFVGVYVSEPHATDEWPLARTRSLKAIKAFSNHPVEIDIEQHTSFKYRQWAANRLKQNLLPKDIPLLVDNMDNAVNNAWVGRPARLYLIDTDGTVIYNPGTGPYSFNPAHLDPILKAYFSPPLLGDSSQR